MQITEQNIEELILHYIDGELDPATAEDVLEYAGKHPKFAAMLEDYQQTVLSPDANMMYPDKEELLRPEITAIPFRRRPAWKFSMTAAASVLLLLSVLAIKHIRNKEEIPTAVKIAKSHTGPAQIAAPILPAIPEAVTAKHNAGVNNMTRPPHRNNRSAAIIQQGSATEVSQPKPQKQPEIAPLPSQKAMRIPQEIELNATMAAVISPQAETAAPARQKLPEWLPVREEKIDVVNELVAQFKEVKERFEEGGRTLKNASFALKIGDKEIGFGKKNHN